jgi:hypothetical protein
MAAVGSTATPSGDVAAAKALAAGADHDHQLGLVVDLIHGGHCARQQLHVSSWPDDRRWRLGEHVDVHHPGFDPAQRPLLNAAAGCSPQPAPGMVSLVEWWPSTAQSCAPGCLSIAGSHLAGAGPMMVQTPGTDDRANGGRRLEALFVLSIALDLRPGELRKLS